MAQTPLTGSTSYASISEFIDRYDVRTVGDLLSDTDTSTSSSEVATSTRLQKLLDQASGEVESACVAGLRYRPADLNALITNGGNGAAYLIGLVCDLAMYKLMNRRPSPVATQPPGPAMAALECLERLRGGERILAFEEAGNAGVEVTKVSIQQGCNVVTAASRYFGFPLCGGCCGSGSTTRTSGGCGC